MLAAALITAHSGAPRRQRLLLAAVASQYSSLLTKTPEAALLHSEAAKPVTQTLRTIARSLEVEGSGRYCESAAGEPGEVRMRFVFV